MMDASATDADIDAVVDVVTDAGGEAFVSRGEMRTIVGLVGDIERFVDLNIAGMPGVLETVRISTAFKLVSRDHHQQRSTVWVGTGTHRAPIGPGTFTTIAGPCAVETPEQTLGAARLAQRLGATILRGGAYKPRTSPYAFQGLGVDGLRILADVRAETGLPIVTEIVDAADTDVVAEYADMLQVGTRNMANFALLQALGQRGQAGHAQARHEFDASRNGSWRPSTSPSAGNLEIVLCERGIRTFETATRNTLDVSAVPVVQAQSHLPIIIDPSHSGGRRELVAPLSRAAVAVGADGVIIDVHPDPTTALCDGPQALTQDDLAELSDSIRDLAAVMHRSQPPAAGA